jgi:hypothetical protein
MLFSWLFFSVGSAIFKFRSTKFSSGEIYQKFFDASDGKIDPNLTISGCTGLCQVELILFREADRKITFPNQRPECLVDAANPSLSLLPDAPVQKKIFPLDQNEASSDLNFLSSGIWGVILSNCGSSDFTITGSISVISPSGRFDSRLRTIWIVSGVLFFITIAFFAFFTFYFVSSPRVSFYHRLFIGSHVLLCVNLFCYFLMLTSWRILDRPPLLLAILCFISRAASLCLSLFLSFVGLQYPLDVLWKAFLIGFVPLALSSAFEVYGIVSFANRTTGSWFLGFGPVPFLDFCFISIASSAVLFLTARAHHEELSQDGKRRLFLVLLFSVFAAYFIASLAACVVRIGRSLTEARNLEWVAFAIQPLYVIGIQIANGWFWWGFNPAGWNQIQEGLPEDAVGGSLLDGPESDSGPIPSLDGKKGKKNKSDDVFDLSDDSGSPESDGKND